MVTIAPEQKQTTQQDDYEVKSSAQVPVVGGDTSDTARPSWCRTEPSVPCRGDTSDTIFGRNQG